MPDKETRKFSSEKVPELYSAMAMVAKAGLSQFILKMVFALKPAPIPMKSFTDDKLAREWLNEFEQ